MGKKYKPFLNLGPGFHIKEQLEDRGWTQEDLAEIIGRSPKHISEVINHKKALTPDFARLLSRAFGQSPEYWLNLYTNFILRQEETNYSQCDTEIKSKIYSYMPIAEMVRRRWIPKWNGKVDRLVESVKNFWDIEEIDFDFLEKEVELAFKKSQAYSEFNKYFALTWYHQAQKYAHNFQVTQYDKKKLQGLANHIPEYSYCENGVSDFLAALEKTGVKFFVLRHFQKTYIDGASFWCGDNPVIVLTGRYNKEDNFWFTIAHEIAHIILHMRKKDSFFIDDLDKSEESKKEEEANAFAVSSIKRNEILSYFSRKRVTSKKIINCSESLRISPAIIVGQLQFLEIISHDRQRRFLNKVIGRIPYKYFPEKQKAAG